MAAAGFHLQQIGGHVEPGIWLAKTSAVGEEIISSGRSARLDDKDAADVVRLMQTTRPDEIASTLDVLAVDEVAGHPTKLALEYIEELFGRRGGSGIEMASRAYVQRCRRIEWRHFAPPTFPFCARVASCSARSRAGRPSERRSSPPPSSSGTTLRKIVTGDRASRPKPKLRSEKKRKHLRLRSTSRHRVSDLRPRHPVPTPTPPAATRSTETCRSRTGPVAGWVMTTRRTSWVGQLDIYRDHSPHAPRSSLTSAQSSPRV
jgi:hypothetical protein